MINESLKNDNNLHNWFYNELGMSPGTSIDDLNQGYKEYDNEISIGMTFYFIEKFLPNLDLIVGYNKKDGLNYPALRIPNKWDKDYQMLITPTINEAIKFIKEQIS